MTKMNVTYCWIILILFSCTAKQSSESIITANRIDPKALVVSKEDWLVQIALRDDSVFRDMEDFLIEEEGMTLSEAEGEIQFMIDNKLLIKPSLQLYTQEGLKLEYFSYVEFKYYIKIVRDSVKNQIARENIKKLD